MYDYGRLNGAWRSFSNIQRYILIITKPHSIASEALIFLTQSAATAVVTTTVAGATAVTIAAEQNEDYKDDNPCAAITIVEKATHTLNPLSMHNMLLRFFCY